MTDQEFKELSKLMAEKVMKWKYPENFGRRYFIPDGHSPDSGKCTVIVSEWSPPTNMNQAIMCLHSYGKKWSIKGDQDTGVYKICVGNRMTEAFSIETSTNNRKVRSELKSLPFNICKVIKEDLVNE